MIPAMVLKVAVPGELVQGDVDEGYGLVAEIPAANGIGQVRAVARAYGEFATGGKTLGLSEATLEALSRPAVAPSGGRDDVVLHIESVFSLGYAMNRTGFRLYDDPRELALRNALYRAMAA